MNRNQIFDALIMITPRDFLRLRRNYSRLAKNLPARHIFFVGNSEVKEQVKKVGLGEKVRFLNEEDILSFSSVHEVIRDVLKDILQGQELPRGITGWYYQQFLKMQYAYVCKDPYYLVWDGDTIPCRHFSMFHEDSDIPYFDMKREYHEEYFTTLSKLLPGMNKSLEKSFISEHMLMNCEIMKNLIQDIERNKEIPGNYFWEKIIRAIGVEQIQENSFSEFETYGTYVCRQYPTAYRLRNWYSFRQGGQFLDPDTISDDDYDWLGKDFYAISFEKDHFVREDQKNLFDNKRYQEKLSARQMLEIAQTEYIEGYMETWD